jgi:hypothetical protein
LSPRWKLDFDDSDFHDGDVSHDVIITATIGDLPSVLISDTKFGYH